MKFKIYSLLILLALTAFVYPCMGESRKMVIMWTSMPDYAEKHAIYISEGSLLYLFDDGNCNTAQIESIPTWETSKLTMLEEERAFEYAEKLINESQDRLMSRGEEKAGHTCHGFQWAASVQNGEEIVQFQNVCDETSMELILSGFPAHVLEK